MEKFEQTINEMKAYIEDLEDDLNKKADKLSESAKAQAKETVEKTKIAINTSIDKVNAVINDIKDDDRLDEFLDKVKAKSKEAVEYTKTKIDELSQSEAGKILDDLCADIMNEFDKLKSTETYKKTTVLLKDLGNKVEDFFEKPEVQETIHKAKVTTVKVAEKGVEGLKKVLDVDNIKKDIETETEEKEDEVEENNAEI